MVFFMVTELELFKLSDQERIDLAYSAADSKTLTVLAADVSHDVREFVAFNPNTPKNVLTVLAADLNENVRSEVAGNPNTAADTLTVLASDLNVSVRGFVAANPNTPVDTLTVLAADVDVFVRRCVAGNVNTSEDVLTILAKDENVSVRWCVAVSPATSSELLWCLLTDVARDVVDLVTARLQTQNLSLMDLSWVDPEILRNIYVTLQVNNLLGSAVLVQLLKVRVSLSQVELIDLCELYDGDVRDTIKNKYNVTHPLLEKILASSQKRALALGVVVGR